MHNKFILVLIVLLISMQTSFADPPLPTPVGRVVWIKGTLKAVMPSNEQRTLQKMSVIYLNDTLITDAQTQAQIVFTDNTLMTFRPDTKFYIDQYAFKPQNKKGSVGKYVMKLLEGGFRTITGLIAKRNPVDYQVNTPVATIGVRGTDYAVYLKNNELLVGFYQGMPCVTGKGTLCLSADKPYAKVPAVGAAPVPVAQQPAVFKDKLDITPAKIAPFTSQVAPVSPGKGGVVSSFCISQ